MNIIGNIHIIGKKALKIILRFFFRKSVVWIDDNTLEGDQEVISNTDWKLYKEGELTNDEDTGVDSFENEV
jgi:hypothetical protein|nr:MAG TPA: hypothetical protein [Herelleviridae sp.]